MALILGNNEKPNGISPGRPAGIHLIRFSPYVIILRQEGGEFGG